MVFAQTLYVSHIYSSINLLEHIKTIGVQFFDLQNGCFDIIQKVYNTHYGMDATYSIYVLENILAMMTI